MRGDPNGEYTWALCSGNGLRHVRIADIEAGDCEVGSADGQAIDLEVVGDTAYYGYDSFGLIAYSMNELVSPLPEGVDPTELFKKEADGTVIYDYRPWFLGKFKLQEVNGFEDVDGGSVKMAYTQQSGDLYFYVAFGSYGIVKIDFTYPEAPVLMDAIPTAAECVDVEIANGPPLCRRPWWRTSPL